MIKKFMLIAALMLPLPAYAGSCEETIATWLYKFRDMRYDGASTIDMKIMLLKLKDVELREGMNRIVTLTEMYPAISDKKIVALEAVNCDFWNEVPPYVQQQ